MLNLRAEFDQMASVWTGLYREQGLSPRRWAVFQAYLKKRVLHRMQIVLDQLTHLHGVSGLRVLEIGCGGGDYGIEIIEGGGIWIGLDFSAEMLNRAQQLLFQMGERPKLVQGDAFHIPVRSQSVDCVLCIGVMSYYRRGRIVDLADEIIRVLRPGGVLITQSIALDIITWIRSRLPPVIPRPIRLPGPLYPHHPNHVRPLLEQKGFDLLDIITMKKFKVFRGGWIYVALRT